MKNAALLVIDVQRDFSEPDGRTPVCLEQTEQMVKVINTLTDRFSAQGIDIIHIFHEWNRRIIQFLLGNSAAKGTPGAELDRRLTAPPAIRFVKHSGNAFSNPEFSSYLRTRGIAHLYVTGLAAEYCVKATIRGALKEGYGVTAVSDGIAARKGKNLSKSLDGYVKEGATLLSSAAVIDAVMG